MLQQLFPPDDPTPRYRIQTLPLPDGTEVAFRDDPYSDRIRCDHPDVPDGEALARALHVEAQLRGRSRLVLLVPARLRAGCEAAGMRHEATMPGFYRGEEDCAVLGLALTAERATPADPDAARWVDDLVRAHERDHTPRDRTPPPTDRATTDDARAIAALINASFEYYPTPSGVPATIAESIEAGIPFRVARGPEGQVVACASADLVRGARTAELTDCATRPDFRGQGLMQGLLTGLLDDLRDLDYPTAFTLARARQPGVNLGFLRVGFAYRGRMLRSCRLGDGIEDINVWSRRL